MRFAIYEIAALNLLPCIDTILPHNVYKSNYLINKYYATKKLLISNEDEVICLIIILSLIKQVSELILLIVQ